MQKNIIMLNLKREYEKINGEVLNAVEDALSSASYILGPQVERLEKEVSKYLVIDYGIGVASGTDALLISLRALALHYYGEEYFSRDQEIITTPFTFTATGSSILRAGATPVFVDINPETYNIEPDKIKKAISPNTVGIVPVHLYGQPCNMEEVMKIANEHSIFVVEDVAQAFGGKWRDAYLGSFGDISAFSFFPSKNLGGFGDGGMIVTDNKDLSIIARMLCKHGGKDKYNVEYVGYNSRLDTIQAAILLVKLNHLQRMNQLRRQIATAYYKALRDIDWLTIPQEILNGEHVYHQYTVRIADGKRDFVQSKLKEKGISTAVYYPVPLHKMKVFTGRSRNADSLVNTEKACMEVLSLPVDPFLEDKELEYVIESIRSIKL